MNASHTQTRTTQTGNPGAPALDALQTPVSANGLTDLRPLVSSSRSLAPALVAGREPSPEGRGFWLARHRVLAVVGFGLAVLLIMFGARSLLQSRSWVKTDNAYLAAHIHSVSARISGTVSEVFIEENQTVNAGTVLARLESREFEVRRDQALAQLSAANAQVQEARALIAQARAQVDRENATAIKSQNDLARAISLFEGGSGAISRQELDLAKSQADAAQAAWQGAKSALESAGASLAVAQAREQAAHAGVEDAELQLSFTRILAPAAGRIGKKNMEVGNRVQPGQALAALVQPDIWINANFKETQLAQLKPGQTVRVSIDAFPGRVFRGVVESLSPASGAQFALLPPDNATGNFTKIVQRVPVRIALDAASLGDCADRLVAGMSALVEVNVHE